MYVDVHVFCWVDALVSINWVMVYALLCNSKFQMLSHNVIFFLGLRECFVESLMFV
jgi:hypothetical protein